MGFECSICLGCHPHPDGYASVRCGHIFHDFCIKKWLDTGTLCPECRGPARVGEIRKVFLKLASAAQLAGNASFSCGGVAGLSPEQETANWIDKYEAKDLRCQELQRELADLRTLEEKLTAESAKNAESVRQYQEAHKKLQSRVKDSQECERMEKQLRKQAEKERNDAKKELDGLRNMNQQLTWVKTMIHGSAEDTDNLLAESTVHNGNFEVVRRTMAASMVALKSELEKNRKALLEEKKSWAAEENRLLAEVKEQRDLVRSLEAEKSEWNEERSRLKTKISAMTRMLEAKPGLPQTQVKRIMAESPAPLDLLSSPLAATTSSSNAYLTPTALPASQRPRMPCLPAPHSPVADSWKGTKKPEDVGPLNLGKMAGRLFNIPPAKPRIHKSLFGTNTPSPIVQHPVTDLDIDFENFRPSQPKKTAVALPQQKRRKISFEERFDPE
ncbi:hypothetical protein BV898_07875 [Hypsibius exemplaris]|uniref:RING-type domain-containing protein n=1 Tax=Hypsibius exemplaris TaxID=2072580 RepID=A0A1W0WSC9_HYPEX|nr:hypothetical protein BV898_07875 [Hypsibius exemplaris]